MNSRDLDVSPAGKRRARDRSSVVRRIGQVVRYLAGDTLMVRSLDRALRPRLARLAKNLAPSARVLDIGAKNALYRTYFSHCSFLTADIDPRHKPDIVADIHELDRAVPEASVDLVICTEVLEHVRSPALAVEQICKALRPGGVLLASTPFTIPYHPDPTDFWRMTREGWAELTRAFSKAEIAWHGNQALSVWYLAGMGYGMPLRLLDRLVFALFGRARGRGVYLGVICEASK